MTNPPSDIFTPQKPESLRWAFLINPVSGAGSGKRIYDQLATLMPELGVEDQFWSRHLTDPAHLKIQVESIMCTHDRLIVAGGDGTIASVLDALLRSGFGHCPVGCIPLGTGNDLARELRLFSLFRKEGLRGMVRTYLQDNSLPFDLWTINGKTCLANYASLGMDAWATQSYAQLRSLQPRSAGVLRNKLAFAWAGFLNVGKRLPPSCMLRLHQNGSVQEVKVGSARTLVLLNISYYAAGLLRADHTRPDDAELTVMVLPRFWHYLVLLATRSLPFTQRLFRRRMLPSWKASRVEVTWEHANAVQVDGESRTDLLDGKGLDVQHAGRIRLLAGAAATGEA